MKLPTFDADGYPSDETIEAIEQWAWQDAAGCLDFVKAAWHYPEYARDEITAGEAEVLHAEKTEKYLRLATGGWSGNEDLIAAIRHNQMVHALTWRLNARGGLHIYRYPSEPR